ncbi:hypothetical protein BH20ACT9_BH20ACT9_03570 [soil metagenome]
MRRGRAGVVAVLVVVLVTALATLTWAHGRDPFRANELGTRLTGRQEVPKVPTKGRGRVELDFFQPASGDGFACYQLRVSRLEADVVAGHIHEGRRGVNGPVVVDLMPKVRRGWTENCVKAPPDLLADILARPGGYYVNVHTDVYPDGEVRGQLHR